MNKTKLSNLESDITIIDEKDKLIIEIDHSKAFSLYLFFSVLNGFIFFSIIIVFAVSPIDLFKIEFVIFPYEWFVFLFLSYVFFYFLYRYLDSIYFHRIIRYVFDNSLQQITLHRVIPKNKKDKSLETSEVKSILVLTDRVDVYHRVNKVLLSLDNNSNIKIMKSRYSHECQSLGRVISEFLDKPLKFKESAKNGKILVYATAFFILYSAVELGFRAPSFRTTAILMIIFTIALLIFYNLLNLREYLLKRRGYRNR